MASAESEAHDIYRKHVNHGGHHEGPHPVPGIQSAAPTGEHSRLAGRELGALLTYRPSSLPALLHVGVIYVSQRAAANGFVAGDKEWANFGQGGE